MYHIKRSIVVKQPLEKVFDFFNRPENLEKITPPLLGFKILTPNPIDMYNGQVIDYEVSIFGLPTRWTTVIRQYNPPHSFVDVQVKGPYSFWHHTHTFEKISDTETRVGDHVQYMVGKGPLGPIANHVLIKHQLKYIFDYRGKVIHELLDKYN
jgi:hypothetical protein